MSAALAALFAAAVPWSAAAGVVISFAMAFLMSEALAHSILKNLRFAIRAIIVVPGSVFATALLYFHLPDANIPVRVAFAALSALVFTLPIAILFALPLELVRGASQRGTSRRDKFEMMLAAFYGAISVGALVWATARESGNGYTRADHPMAFVFGDLGVLVALIALLTGALRLTRRTRFLGRVEAGSEPGFRIEAAEGKRVLVRHRVGPTDGYRETDMREELFELNADGDLREPFRD